MKKKAKRKPDSVAEKATQILQERGFREVVALGGQNDDWALSNLTMDSSVWQNIFAMRARMRDLYDQNPYYQKYRESSLWANVFGEQGIMLRMKVKEMEDRVIYDGPEKWAIIEHERRLNRVRQWAARKIGQEFQMRSFDDTRVAHVKVGEPDVYANRVIEEKWQEWQRAEFCDIRKRRSYNVLRQLRLVSAARDGDHFIRLIRDPRVNKFGFTLQLINAEWCDYFYNTVLSNGNVVRMGVEYKSNDWGISEPVAYYFIKRQPNDWQFTVPGAFNFASGNMHERIAAKDIIHYARFTDAESTRPAPWGANSIPKTRQLDQYELAEVVAARAAATKTGWLYSDLLPEGGDGFVQPDPSGIRNLKTEAGGIYGLPWGIKYQSNDPNHPNGNFEGFRKGMGRSWSAGNPGADYNVIFNDLENINFSAGRLGRLDSNEGSKLLQQFDIDTAERPIFEAWLEMSLATGAVPLSLANFERKYKGKAVFSGRRWAQVDEVKAVNAAALRVANKFSSRSKECADEGIDFEDNAFELAEEEMLLEELGLSTATTADAQPKTTETEVEEPGEDSEEDPKKPKNGKPKKNGKALDFSRALAINGSDD